MKKILSILMAVVCIFTMCAVGFSASAVSVTNYGECTDEFTVCKAANGMKYAAFEPELKEGVKYPLIIYVHGLGHAWNDTTFKQSGLTYWASEEMQAKFNEGGAYLLMPKIPEVTITALQTENVFKVIQEYVNAHSNTIDKNRIYIMGGSAGGALTWRILIAHPDYFAKAVVLCGCKSLTSAEAKKISNIPIWMISAKTDPLVWYFLFSGPNWNTLIKNTKVKGQCRHTVFAKDVQLPDGNEASISHLLAKTIGYNLCRISDSQPLSGMTTTDGYGNNITLNFNNSIVEWFQAA